MMYKFYLGAFRIELESADSVKSSEIEPSSPRDADAVQNKLRFKVNLYRHVAESTSSGRKHV